MKQGVQTIGDGMHRHAGGFSPTLPGLPQRLAVKPQTREAIHQGALAQDTGGAIRGRIRADYYWGTGNAAGEAAGLTKQPLRMWLIWPKGAVLPNAGAGPIN